MDIRLHILEKITNGFSVDSRIGRGGYGDVYQGVYNGEMIAVKLLHVDMVQGLDDQQFKNEVGNLLRLKHPNVVRLLGYCYETRSKYVEHNGENVFGKHIYRVLCFEYLQGGNLDMHLHAPSLAPNWSTRYNIIKGVCEGLNFLHSCEPPIFHLDIKPANILLDSSMDSKLADLGLSRLFTRPHTHVTKRIVGTQKYMPPEFMKHGIISSKNDVFSLGVVIIEIVTGPKGYSDYSEMGGGTQFMQEVLTNWSTVIEATWKYRSEEILQVKTCIELALRCVDSERDNRPTVADILDALSKTETHILKRKVIPGSILDVDPLELCFRFEPNKLIACSLDLTNNTDEKVAFVLPKKSYEETCFFRRSPMFGIVDPRTTYTLVLILDKHENLPREKNVDLILQTSIYSKSSSDEQTCMQHFENAEQLGITVHQVTLKGVFALQGETIFEHSIPPSVKIISTVDIFGSISSMDANQTEPLIITCSFSGHVHMWNCDTQKFMYSRTLANEARGYSIKFIARKGWFVVGSDDGFITLYDYNEMKNITCIMYNKAHDSPSDACPLAIHPTKSYLLSARNAEIKLWDWGWRWLGWMRKQTYAHDRFVHAMAFNPEDYNSFASASDDGTIKVWSLNSSKFECTLSGHSSPVRCLEFFTRDGRQYLITGSEDKTAKIWGMQRKDCVRTLRHRSEVLSVLPHPKLPVLLTGTMDGDVYFWSSSNFRLKRILKIGGRIKVQGLAFLIQSGRIAVAHEDGLSVIEIRDEEEQVGSSGQ